MIWKNAELHNVAELTPHIDGGYIMHRIPEKVSEHLSSAQGKRMSIASTGVEIRFKIKSGTARMEKELADHISTLDFDVATVEMGINVVGSYTPEEFYERSKYFLETVALSHPNSQIFAIDIFYCSGDMKGNAMTETFRGIIKQITEDPALPNVHHVRGTEMLTGSHGLSGDLTHPNPRGVEEIARNLTERVLSVIGK